MGTRHLDGLFLLGLPGSDTSPGTKSSATALAICWNLSDLYWYPKMDGENNGQPYEQMDDLS